MPDYIGDGQAGGHRYRAHRAFIAGWHGTGSDGGGVRAIRHYAGQAMAGYYADASILYRAIRRGQSVTQRHSLPSIADPVRPAKRRNPQQGRQRC